MNPDHAYHDAVLVFGKHVNTRIVNVPIGYLKWMVNTKTQQAKLAQLELDRRGYVMPEIEVSGHAIDRASLWCRAIWHEDANEGEGLHAWLLRRGLEATTRGEVRGDKRIWAGLKWVFAEGSEFPVLKTVSPATRSKGKR